MHAYEMHAHEVHAHKMHTLTSVNDLALVFGYQGKYEAADEMYRRALEGREKVLGVEHPHTH
jgi:Tfp pilus assembly protein PilF